MKSSPAREPRSPGCVSLHFTLNYEFPRPIESHIHGFDTVVSILQDEIDLLRKPRRVTRKTMNVLNDTSRHSLHTHTQQRNIRIDSKSSIFPGRGRRGGRTKDREMISLNDKSLGKRFRFSSPSVSQTVRRFADLNVHTREF